MAEDDAMLDIQDDLELPPSSPTVRLLLESKEAGQPITLTVNGRTELKVQDDKSLDMLLELVDRLELLQTLRRATNELDEGKGLTLEQVREESRKKYGISL
jgi:hypothetical protein